MTTKTTQRDILTFKVSGQIKLHLEKQKGGRVLSKSEIDRVIRENEAYTQQIGCYVFSIRAAKGYTPIYVGMTRRQCLGKEAFSRDKLSKIYEALATCAKGSLVVSFVVPNKKIAGDRVDKAISEIEKWLIKVASIKNSRILNVKNVKVPTWSIQGVVNRSQGKPSAEAEAFKSMLSLD